jgi:hypothetical protein
MMTIDEIRQAVHQLTPQEKAQIISELAADLATQQQPASAPQPKRDFYGALAHLGKAPSAEDIDEVRREVWSVEDV